MSMRKRRKMRRSRGMSMGKSRTMRRSRTMRGGKLTNDSSFSTLIAASSDNSSNLASSSGDFQQNVDRNNSSISGEGAPINMSAPAFKGLIPPQGYYGGKRRRARGKKMRGGEADPTGMFQVDDSEAAKADRMLTTAQLDSVSGGRRRRMSMRGGENSDVPGAPDSSAIMTNPSTMMGGRRRRRMRGMSMRGMSMRGGSDVNPEAPMNPDKDALTGGRRRRRRMLGGMYDNNLNADVVNPSGGSRSRKRAGGGIIATAALPFGLFGLQRYFQGRKKQHTRRR